MLRFFTYIFFIPFMCLSVICFAQANEFPTAISSDGSLTSDDDLPWKIYADSLVSINDGVVIEGRGNVLLTRGDDYLKADFARLYTNTQWILLQGKVYAKLGEDEVEAKEAEFDLTNSTGWLHEAKLFLAGPHMYFKSEEVIKKGESKYSLVKASATTCDGSVPLWKIEAKEAELEVDSYAHFMDVVFNIKNTPAFYTPYVFAPTKTTRQSGLLLPSYGFSSKQGLFYTQPYYHVIDQSRDLTLYATVMTERGFMPSIEYRAHTKENEKLWAMVDIFYDKDKIRNENQDDVDNTDGNIRTNTFRFWARAMGNGDILETDWKYKYNLDFVSDQNFIREFKNRMTGFDNTRTQSYDMFGRDFAEADQNRITQGYVYNDFDKFYVTAGAKYTQDPSFGHGNKKRSEDTTVQHLPEIALYWYRDEISDTLPFEWNMYSGAGYYYRRSGTKGGRLETVPELTLPVNISFLRGELTGSTRASFYTGISEHYSSALSDSTNRERQDGNSRFIPSFGAKLYANANRVWHYNEELSTTNADLGKTEIVAIKHAIQPRLLYQWTDRKNQEDNPFFTVEDRIQNQNNLTLRFDNFWSSKTSSIVRQKEGIKKVYSYLEMVSFKVSSGYDFREADRKKHAKQFENRPWHDLRSRLTIKPLEWVDFYGDSFYSFYDGKFNRLDVGTTLYHKKYGSFSTSYSQREPNYDYRRFVNYDNINDVILTEKVNVITNTLKLNVNPQYYVYALERTDLDNGESYERILGVGYNHQCVKIYGEYSKDPIEERIGFNLELLGLGF